MKRGIRLTTGDAPDRSPARGSRGTNGDAAIRARIMGRRAPERPLRADLALAIADTRHRAFIAAMEAGGEIARMYGGPRAAARALHAAHARAHGGR